MTSKQAAIITTYASSVMPMSGPDAIMLMPLLQWANSAAGNTNSVLAPNSIIVPMIRKLKLRYRGQCKDLPKPPACLVRQWRISPKPSWRKVPHINAELRHNTSQNTEAPISKNASAIAKAASSRTL
ncbi:MAG: hypothetical protein Q9199_002893 [Rusavskia elegans]